MIKRSLLSLKNLSKATVNIPNLAMVGNFVVVKVSELCLHYLLPRSLHLGNRKSLRRVTPILGTSAAIMSTV